jgi:hypothetical protein
MLATHVQATNGGIVVSIHKLVTSSWLAATLGAMCACSSSRVAEPGPSNQVRSDVPLAAAPTPLLAATGAGAATDAGTAVPGYVHDLSRSLLRIGTGVTTEPNSGRLVRWRGSLGAFTLDPNSGWTMGVIDGTTPHGPYLVDEATHSATVKAYFINAGIPSNQVGGVYVDYGVRGGNALTDTTAASPTQLTSIISGLTRAIGGIRVAESFAWARVTTAGDVDMESVFWPPLDASIVSAAQSMAAKLSDPSAHASYLAALPGTVYGDNGVVIHHTSSAISSAPVAYAAYDVVLDPSPSAGVRHFDASGHEFRLPQETLSLPPSGPKIRH